MTAAWGVGVDRELIRQHGNALDRIATALALHMPVDPDAIECPTCPTCTVVDDDGMRRPAPWPCRTWVALDNDE